MKQVSRASLRAIFAAFLFLVLSSCATQPYRAEDLPQNGRASWYGKAHHGKKTASGERFNMYALTAAHRTLPFGTKVRVTNKSNDRSVVVTVNDRGPYAKGRVLDLSFAAASRLGIINLGEGEVRIDKP